VPSRPTPSSRTGASEDIIRSYNAYVTKSIDYDDFQEALARIHEFFGRGRPGLWRSRTSQWTERIKARLAQVGRGDTC
jgi:hypothetical protein